MAKVWITYREGHRLVGAPVSDVSLDRAIPRLDLAPWRLFAAEPPTVVTRDRVDSHAGRKRVLVEVGEADRNELCGLSPGFFESPYSPEESLRRLAAR